MFNPDPPSPRKTGSTHSRNTSYTIKPIQYKNPYLSARKPVENTEISPLINKNESPYSYRTPKILGEIKEVMKEPQQIETSLRMLKLEKTQDDLQYMSGFGSHFVTEALKDSLPKNQNNPQKCNFGLYAEQLSGTPFTYPRSKNQYSWLYRIMPSSVHEAYMSLDEKFMEDNKPSEQFLSNFQESDKRLHVNPDQIKWKPMKMKGQDGERTAINFVQGIKTLCGAGDPTMKDGLGIHTYSCNSSMYRISFYSGDGDMLIVPQVGSLYITTELGRMIVEPQEICVIQRGIKFRVDLGGFKDQDHQVHANENSVRGFICETYGSHFNLPDLGPIGANSLANPMHFKTPVSWYEDKSAGAWTIISKYQGEFFQYEKNCSPFDVVAWHGNYAPYKYDLRKFNSCGSISYDTPDSSIQTVLTCMSDDPGQPTVNFSCFPPRWQVAAHTLRKPYNHRSTMSEFTANIISQNGGKDYHGLYPGQSSLQSTMTSSGLDQESFESASNEIDQKPELIDQGAMSFKISTCYMMKITDYAMHPDNQELEKKTTMIRHFDPNNK